MILPIRDILSTEPSKAFRFGHHGLVVIVRGHEELFFEFADEERRTTFVMLLSKQIEDVRRRTALGAPPPSSDGQREALVLEEFGPSTLHQLTESDVREEPDDLTESVPAVMFTSQSSTFLTFKPKESLHFTFLTIGSRGDVQPYIALAKGLMADGHRCRIATHGEFKDWIESVSQLPIYSDLIASDVHPSMALNLDMSVVILRNSCGYAWKMACSPCPS